MEPYLESITTQLTDVLKDNELIESNDRIALLTFTEKG